MPADVNPEHTEVVACWLDDAVLSAKAASGTMSHISKRKSATRADVIANYETLLPCVQILGPKVNIDVLKGHVREYLWKTRPRGKPELPSVLYAWYGMFSILPTRTIKCVFLAAAACKAIT